MDWWLQIQLTVLRNFISRVQPMYGVSLTSSSPPRHSAVKVDAVHDSHEIRFSRFNLNHNKLNPADFSRNFAELFARNLSRSSERRQLL